MINHGRMNIEVFVDPMFQENAFVVGCEGGSDCWIIDPGFPPQPEAIVAAVAERELEPVALMLTHCHPDHIAGLNALRAAYPQTPIVAPYGEKDMLTDPEANLSTALGFAVSAPPADQLLKPGDTAALGDLTWRVLDVSGHSPAGLAFYCADVGVVINGDALFAGSIGRFDFPHSSRERLIKNISENLLTLPDDTVVYSGHGPATTIGHERQHNSVLLFELSR